MSGSSQSSAPKNKEKSANGFGSSGLETIEDHLEHDDYTEEMNSRMREKFELKIPDIDLIDLDKQRNLVNPKKRQFAPLYSHSAYKATL